MSLPLRFEACVGKVLRVHRRANSQAGVEREKPRFRNCGQLRGFGSPNACVATRDCGVLKALNFAQIGAGRSPRASL